MFGLATVSGAGLVLDPLLLDLDPLLLDLDLLALDSLVPDPLVLLALDLDPLFLDLDPLVLEVAAINCCIKMGVGHADSIKEAESYLAGRERGGAHYTTFR